MISPIGIVLIVIAAIIVLVLLFGVVPTFFVALKVWKDHLVRKSPDQWKRGECNFDDQESVDMYNRGMDWHERNKDFAKPVQITSDGLHLCGEYYDFGFKRAVIFLAGRTEALTYGYYFVQPYRDLGYNILVIDNRAHGESEGKYNTVGLNEYRDIIGWIKLLNEELKNEKVLIHGVCIGSAAGIKALVDPACPGCVEGIVCDGTYTTFSETFKTHMIQLKKPVFPVCREVMFLIQTKCGQNPYKCGPIVDIKKVTKPILMLYGKKDQFSLPEKSQILFNSCPSEQKTLVWFEEGGHSHLRINAEEKYDAAIKEFVETHFN